MHEAAEAALMYTVHVWDACEADSPAGYSVELCPRGCVDYGGDMSEISWGFPWG